MIVGTLTLIGGGICLIRGIVFALDGKISYFVYCFLIFITALIFGLHFIKTSKNIEDLYKCIDILSKKVFPDKEVKEVKELLLKQEEEKPQKPIPGIRELTDEEFNELVKKQEEERKKEQKD